MDLAKIRHAVRLTAQCKSIDYNWQAPPDERFAAVLWCNAVGECVVGYGDDEWTAVQAAHAISARYEMNPQLFPF
jgi:hypothetical protein